jgi:aryl-alcohol dehydrogenase-like predicted oxidoreductase
MTYSTLGNTDLKVSRICLGTMTFGEQNTEQDGHDQMNYAIDRGINFFDTAEMYSVPAREETCGRTEEIIGTWLAARGKRDDIILATKAAGPADWLQYLRGNPNYSREQLREAVHNSLKRLKTDYIDLYQLHWPERPTNFFGQLSYHHRDDHAGTAFLDILRSLNELMQEGKIRYIGLSNETPWGVSEYLKLSALHELPRMMSIQNPYNLLNRVFEVGLAEMAIRDQVGLLAYSPMGFGVLSGKYLHGMQPPAGRITLFPRFARYSNPRAVEATERYVSIARDNGLSPAQLALAWVNSRPFLTSNIIGATTMEQLKENIDSIHIDLSPEVIEAVEQVHADIPNPSP